MALYCALGVSSGCWQQDLRLQCLLSLSGPFHNDCAAVSHAVADSNFTDHKSSVPPMNVMCVRPQAASVQASAVQWVTERAVSTGTAAAAMPERIAHIDAAMGGLQDGTFQPRVRVMQSERFSRRAGILQVLAADVWCLDAAVGTAFLHENDPQAHEIRSKSPACPHGPSAMMTSMPPKPTHFCTYMCWSCK